VANYSSNCIVGSGQIYGEKKTPPLPSHASNDSELLQEVRMKYMLWGLLLAFAASAFAQQPPPTGQPPYTTPPTFPQDKTPGQQMPPDTKAPPSETLSTAQVQEQIQEKLRGEPALANTNVGVKATENSVTLSGSVDTERQHDLAIRIAQSYAGDRKILDRIKVQARA
jgi:hyperosmotically inducible protein